MGRNVNDMEKPLKIDIDLPHDALRFLPHRPPMLFVDTLLERSGDTAVGSATMPQIAGFTGNSTGFPEVFVEIIAQTVAMANGYDACCEGKVIREGMLVGVDDFSFEGNTEPGATLRVVVEKTFEFGAIKIIHGEVFCEGKLIVRGDIKVWENIDG